MLETLSTRRNHPFFLRALPPWHLRDRFLLDDVLRIFVVVVLLGMLQNVLVRAVVKVHLVAAVLVYGCSASQVAIRVGSTVGIRVYVYEGIKV